MADSGWIWISRINAEASRRTRALTLITHTTKALNQHRVMRKSRRIIEQGVQNLVIPSRAKTKQFVDRVVFRTRVAPPLALKVEDLSIALRQVGARGSVQSSGLHVPPSPITAINSCHTKP